MEDPSDPSTAANDPLQQYRTWLIAAEQKAQEDYDKTVLSLSGGALGVSFAFVKDVVGAKPLLQLNLLLAAWIAWGLSVTFVLASFHFSQRALRRAITQIDKDDIYRQSPGGVYSEITTGLNAAGGLLFLVGVALIILFASHNLR